MTNLLALALIALALPFQSAHAGEDPLVLSKRGRLKVEYKDADLGPTFSRMGGLACHANQYKSGRAELDCGVMSIPVKISDVSNGRELTFDRLDFLRLVNRAHNRILRAGVYHARFGQVVSACLRSEETCSYSDIEADTDHLTSLGSAPQPFEMGYYDFGTPRGPFFGARLGFGDAKTFHVVVMASKDEILARARGEKNGIPVIKATLSFRSMHERPEQDGSAVTRELEQPSAPR